MDQEGTGSWFQIRCGSVALPFFRTIFFCDVRYSIIINYPGTADKNSKTFYYDVCHRHVPP
jgi:hypothetical protein